MKRIVTIQDISCLGKCSLTVALPIISAMGIETCAIPTAVFSNHTMFEKFISTDLTEDILPIAKLWKEEGFDFDAIYTGYLGSFHQIEVIEEFIDEFKKNNTCVFIDPVMADNGSLYPGFTIEYAKAMSKLCSKADVIIPNMTEAAFLLERPYVEKGYDEQYIKNLLYGLTDLGAKTAVLTGVSFEEGSLGVMSYNSQDNSFCSYFSTHIPVSYHGTGDIFSSTLLGAYLKYHDMQKSLKTAVDFTVSCIDKTYKNPDSHWYGVDFEACLPSLIRNIE